MSWRSSTNSTPRDSWRFNLPEPRHTRLGSKLSTLRSLSWAERRLLAKSAVLVAGVRLILAFVPFRRLYPIMERATSGPRDSPWDREAAAEIAHTVARMVEMASRNSVGQPTCLHRSIAVWWLLRRRGLESELRFGVRKRGEGFEAHAWVEHAGGVVNDQPMTADEYRRLNWLFAGRDA